MDIYTSLKWEGLRPAIPPFGYANVSRDDSELAMATRTSHNRTPVSGFTPNENTRFLVVGPLNLFLNTQLELALLKTNKLDWHRSVY